MEQKAQVVCNALHQLDDLEKSVAGEYIDNPDVLATKINMFVSSLSAMFDEGNTMDESTVFPIPLELLEHIDRSEDNNPELFGHKRMEQSQARADALSNRLNYLDDLGKLTKQEIDLLETNKQQRP